MQKYKSYFRHKDKRLYFRYKKIFRLVCLCNPSVNHSPKFIDGIGIIEVEWDWINGKIMELSYSIPYESEFYVISKQIITFLRYKNKK